MLQDKGTSVVLSNGLLTATIAKDKATVTSILFKGTEMVASVYYSMDGGKDFRVPSHCVYAVHSATPDMVDVQMTSLWQREVQAFDIEVHYVLRRGATGLYSYAVLTHPASYPDTGHGEWRMVWKLPEDLLEKICVDDLRHWQMPNSNDLKHAEKTPIKEIVKLTTGVMAGQYDCKYKYSAEYWDLGCWGQPTRCGTQIGKPVPRLQPGAVVFLQGESRKQAVQACHPCHPCRHCGCRWFIEPKRLPLRHWHHFQPQFLP